MTTKSSFSDKYIAPRWWRSTAMWVGILAGLVQYLPDYIQAFLDHLDLVGGLFDWTDSTKRQIQTFLLLVVLPIAKAWKQKKIEQAVIAQATRNELVVPLPASHVTVRGELL